MFYIHGGAFFNGSGGTQMYGPQYLLDKDIILVTINYRLGTLGTLKGLNHLLYL
jgi:carboxylesterase type B